jgi:hypothetical protein
VTTSENKSEHWPSAMSKSVQSISYPIMSACSLMVARFSAQMAGLFTEVFNWLPLAHCINNKILVRLREMFTLVFTNKERPLL